jgi:hypothetical protein
MKRTFVNSSFTDRLVLTACCILILAGLSAQNPVSAPPRDTATNVRIEMLDGTVLLGKIKSRGEGVLSLTTLSGVEANVPVSQIREMTSIDITSIHKGEYWFENPNATRYLFGPSAFNLKKGEGYYQNTWLLLNSFNYGITDYFSIGGGIELISTFNGSPSFILTPKVGFKTGEKTALGGGLLLVNVGDFFDSNTLGIAYGVITRGTVNRNITAGVGWGFVDGEFSARPITTFSGLTRVSKKVALLSENWIIPSDSYYPFFSYGVRFFGEKLAVDLAFVNNPDIASEIVIGIPYVDFVVKFGKRK